MITVIATVIVIKNSKVFQGKHFFLDKPDFHTSKNIKKYEEIF